MTIAIASKTQAQTAVKMQLRSLIVALALGATSAFMRPASVSRVTARLASQRPSYPEVLRGLREATAARRCKRGASAVRYQRANRLAVRTCKGTGSGTNAGRRPSPAAVAVGPLAPRAPQLRRLRSCVRHSGCTPPPPLRHGRHCIKRCSTAAWRRLRRERAALATPRQRGNASFLHRFSVEDKLKEIVAEQLGVEQSSITPEASFASDLGADSLDVVEMVMKIEEEFNVELPDERAEEVQNLSDAVRVVTELTA